MFCTNCGSKINEDAMFCSKCGTKVAIPTNSTSKEHKPTEPITTPTDPIKASILTPTSPDKSNIPSNANFIIRHLNKFWWTSIVYNVLTLGTFVIFTDTGYDTMYSPHTGGHRVPSPFGATDTSVIVIHLVFILIGVALTFWLARISNPQELRTQRTYTALAFLAATIVSAFYYLD